MNLHSLSTSCGIKVINHHKCLITQLALELAAIPNDQLEKCLVVLPTQRLAQYLMAALASKKEAFLPPIILTLESFIKQYADCGQVQTISSHTEEAVLASLVQKGSFKHLKKGLEHEIRELFVQITSRGQALAYLESFKKIIYEDVYRNDSHIGSYIERIDELIQLYKQYQEILTAHKVLTKDQYLIECCQSLEKKWSQQEELPWKRLYFSSFTTTKPYTERLLSLLLTKANVQLWSSPPAPIYGKENPLKDLLTKLASRSFDFESIPPFFKVKNHKRVFQMNSLSDEVEHCVFLLKKYLESGSPPSRIGVLVSDEKKYTKLLKCSFEKAHITANFAVTQAYQESLTGLWLVSILDFFGKRTSKASFKAFFLNPMSYKFFKEKNSLVFVRTVNYQSYMADIYGLCSQWQDGKTWQAFLRKQSNEMVLEIHQNILDMFGFWFEHDEANKLLTPSGWLQEFYKIIVMFDIEQCAETTSELQAFKQCLDSWRDLACLSEDKVAQDDFLHICKDIVTKLDMRSVGFPLADVQVINLVEARYVPFDVMIYLGCHEGSFPKALPSDHLIDDWIKVRAGLSGWSYIEALENTTFHLLCSQGRYHEFLYYESNDSPHLSRSRFLDSLCNYNEASFHHVENTIQASKRQENLPQGLESYGAYVQDRLQLFRQISASSLSFLFTCPYRFLLHKLQLREDLSEEKQKTLWEGRWLHQIFEAFYTGQIEGKRIITPLPRKLTLKTNEIIEFAVERLSVITKKSIPSDLQGSPLQLHLAKYAWPRFAKHWASFFRQVNTQESIFETQAVLCEHAVDTQSHSLKLWEESVQITGSLDNFVSFNGHFILTDYKRKGVDSVAQVQKGLAPQLPLYALAMQENPQTCELMTKGVSGYWSIIEGKWYPRAKSSGPSDLSSETKLCSSQTPIIEQQIRTLQALWQEVVQSFVVEKKPFQPQVSEACDFCSFHGICRKNDPTIQASRQQLETSNG